MLAVRDSLEHDVAQLARIYPALSPGDARQELERVRACAARRRDDVLALGLSEALVLMQAVPLVFPEPSWSVLSQERQALLSPTLRSARWQLDFGHTLLTLEGIQATNRTENPTRAIEIHRSFYTQSCQTATVARSLQNAECRMHQAPRTSLFQSTSSRFQ
jgi:hypothetical protein